MYGTSQKLAIRKEILQAVSEQYDVSVSAVDSGIRRMIDSWKQNRPRAGRSSRLKAALKRKAHYGQADLCNQTVSHPAEEQGITHTVLEAVAMEQAQQNTAQELTAQAIPQQAVEDACFHSLG